MIETIVDWLGGRRKKASQASGCLSCGDCCALFGGHLSASRTDLERWRREGREDLLNRVNRLGWIWVDPQDGHRLDPCPFLQPDGSGHRICSIHDTKPEICRSYPTLAHAHRCLRGVFLGALGMVVDLLSEAPLFFSWG